MNTSYIIFICTFDPFNRGRALYKFHNTCEDEVDTLELKDKEYKIFLNSKSHEKADNPDLAAFLRYIDGKAAEGDFTKEVAEAVKELQRSPMERRTYMLLSQVIKEREDARFKEGIEQGQIQERNSIALRLLKKGHTPESIAEDLNISLQDVLKLTER